MNQEFKDNYQIQTKKPLNEQVYDSLKQMMLDDVLKPSQKLNETDIADVLGVSATPVREAFKRLAAEGFVEIIPYKGVYVREYTITELKEVYQCREQLELLALDLAFPNIEESDIDNLIDDLNTYKDSKDLGTSVDLSNMLHDYIIVKSNNKRLKILLDNLNDVILRDRNITAGDECRKLQIHEEHMDILKSMKSKNLDQSKLNLSKHIKNGFKYIENQIANI